MLRSFVLSRASPREGSQTCNLWKDCPYKFGALLKGMHRRITVNAGSFGLICRTHASMAAC